jgi:tRNA G10  N-methylase Trm11
MRYIFTAGSFPNLSYAELRSVLEVFGYNPDSVKKFSEKVLIADSKDLTDDIVLRIFQRLGGFTRVGKEIEDLDSFLLNFDSSSKIVFGISLISEINKREDKNFVEKLSRQIKKYFVSRKIPCRFVLPKKTELNSAQVKRNQIIEKGFELVISDNGQEKIYSQTLDVQDVDAFAQRDMDRPYVDVDMGTLPPKLARIMVNLSQVKEGGVIWDPFCGSGTILLESLMSGINVLGSDIDPKALMYTEENIKWLSEKNLSQDVKYDLFELDVLNPNAKIVNQVKNTGVDAVVCEPYMGPPQKRYIDDKEADKLLSNVKDLYIHLFDIFKKISFEGFRVVMVIPSYKTKIGWRSISLGDIVDSRWELENKKHGRDLKWKRNNSIIMRNIFILTKK